MRLIVFIIFFVLAVEPVLGENTIELIEPGWYLLSPGDFSEMELDNLMETQSKLQSVWSWKENQWAVCSRIYTQNDFDFNDLLQLHAQKGYWFRTNGKVNIPIHPSESLENLQNYPIPKSSGWRLFGTSTDIDVIDFFAQDLPEQGTVWSWNKQGWYIYTVGDIDETNQFNNTYLTNFENLRTISAYNGFWVNWIDPAENQLKSLISKLPDLNSRLDALKDQGVDIAYPILSLAILEDFASFITEDLFKDEADVVRSQLDELSSILLQLEEELTWLEAGNYYPDVPRYVISPVTIEDGAFKATVKWPDGTEEKDWPVIFNGYDGDKLYKDVDLISRHGMHIIQVEIGPSWILMEENENSLIEVDRLLSLLDNSAENNVLVNILLSPHYFPEWAYNKWPDIKKNSDDEYIPFSVNSSNLRLVLEKYLRILIPKIKEHPALHSVTLTNEPSYFNAFGAEGNRDAYTEWLQEKYGTIEAVSAAHEEIYASYEDVPVFYIHNWKPYPEEKTNPVALHDYFEFNDKRFSEWHSWMTDIIHEESPDLPVHVKIPGFSGLTPYEGIDPEQFNEFSQIAGNDSSKYYLFDTDYGYANEWIDQNLLLDLQRSTSNFPIFNSENHVVPDHMTEKPIPPEHFRNVFWQAAIHGQGASTVWLWDRNVLDESANEKTRASILNQPLGVLEHGRVALDTLRLGKEIHAFQTAPARIAIIYSATSLRYRYEEYESCLIKLYQTLNFTGEKLAFITENQLKSGIANQYEMILAYGVKHLPLEVYTALEKYDQNGGLLVLIGDGILTHNATNKSVSLALQNAVYIEDQTPENLRLSVIPLLEKLPGGRPVIISDIASNEEPWGVEWLTVEKDGMWLVNITNYNLETITLKFEKLPSENRIDLITMKSISDTLKLSPLETMLIRVPQI